MFKGSFIMSMNQDHFNGWIWKLFTYPPPAVTSWIVSVCLLFLLTHTNKTFGPSNLKSTIHRSLSPLGKERHQDGRGSWVVICGVARNLDTNLGTDPTRVHGSSRWCLMIEDPKHPMTRGSSMMLCPLVDFRCRWDVFFFFYKVNQTLMLTEHTVTCHSCSLVPLFYLQQVTWKLLFHWSKYPLTSGVCL